MQKKTLGNPTQAATKEEVNKLFSFCFTAEALYPSNHFDKHYGGFIGLNSWVSCLGPSEGLKQDILLFFPKDWVKAEDIERWCRFLSTHYGLIYNYLGDFNLSTRLYGFSDSHCTCVPSHVIRIDYQSALYASAPRFSLFKVTLARYLYRPDHHLLIAAVYNMVENHGINSWDALFLSHYYLQAIGHAGSYSGGRGLIAQLNVISFPYPRNLQDLVRGFEATKQINSVWGAFVCDPAVLAKNQGRMELASILTYYGFLPTAESHYFYNPYMAVETGKLFSLLRAEKFAEARDFYLATVSQFYKLVLDCNLSLSPQIGGPYSNYKTHVEAFLTSLKNTKDQNDHVNS